MIINGESLLLAKPIKDMSPVKNREHGVSWGLGEAGYDIRLKQGIVFYNHNSNPVITIDDEVKYYTRFTIASTIEEFQMPDNLTGIVHDKSTWARRGISVFNTVIEPGWNGFLTLEIVFHGSEKIIIPAGSGIAQVIFHETKNLAKYNGKYQNQEDKPIQYILEV